jgi:putative acetyltransferase
MIRLMKDTDIDAVMDIWFETNITAHDFIPEEYWLGNYNAVKGEYLPKSDNYVYEEKGKIKGFISIMQPSFIGALFVAKDSHNKGIGGKFVEFCKSKYGYLDVAVYAQNKQAIGFYEKHEFTKVKEKINPTSSHLEYILEWTDEIE